MKTIFSLDDLIEDVNSIISQNCGSLSESDLETLQRCKSKLKELKKVKRETDAFLFRKTLSEVVIQMLKYFLQD